MMPKTAAPGEDGALRTSALRHLAAALAAAAAAAVALATTLGLGAVYVAASLAVAAAGAAAVLRHLPGRHPHARFGPANAVTLARAVPIVLVAGLVVVPTSWAVAAFAALAGTLSMILDGLDGRLARRHGVESPFGARFDMEADSLLVMALAVLAWRWDRAGAWVLLSGLMRYLFVAAGGLAPWLRRPLPPRWRRQAVCVLQIVVLLAVVAPLLPAAASAPLALAGLLVLAGSFAADVAWLARRARAPLEEEVSRC
jgi:phosphatidylglycerophosphate synthase